MANTHDAPGPRLPAVAHRADITPLMFGEWGKKLVDVGYHPRDEWPVRVVRFPDGCVRPVFSASSSEPPADRWTLGVPLTIFEDTIWAVELPASDAIYVRQVKEQHFFEEHLAELDGRGGVVSEWEAAAVAVAYEADPEAVQPPLREAVQRHRARDVFDTTIRRLQGGPVPGDAGPRPTDLAHSSPPGQGGNPCPLRFRGDGRTLEGIQPDGSYTPLVPADSAKTLTPPMIADLRILIGNHGRDTPESLSANVSDTLNRAVKLMPGLAAYIDRPGKAGGGPRGRIRLRNPHAPAA